MFNQLNYAAAGREPWTCEVISRAGFSYTKQQAAQINDYVILSQRPMRPPEVILTVRMKHQSKKCRCYEVAISDTSKVCEIAEGKTLDRQEEREKAQEERQEQVKSRVEQTRKKNKKKREARRKIAEQGEIQEEERIMLESQFRGSLDDTEAVVAQGKRLGIYDEGSMTKLNVIHYEVYTQLLTLLPRQWHYYVPGDGDGVMSYLLWKNKYKYYSCEPSDLGRKAKEMGILQQGSYDPQFKCDCVLALNTCNDFMLSAYHMRSRFVVIDDKSQAIPDWMYGFCVSGTRARLFTNVVQCAKRLPALQPAAAMALRLRELPYTKSYSPQDVFHLTMMQEYDYNVSSLDGSTKIGFGHLDLLTNQNHFEPNSYGIFYGKEGDYYFVEGRVCWFKEGRNVHETRLGVRIVECQRRRRITYKLRIEKDGVYVKLSRYKPYIRACLVKRGPEYIWHVCPGPGPIYRLQQQETMKYKSWMYGKVLYPGKSPS